MKFKLYRNLKRQ